MQAYFESQRDYDTLFHIENKENDRCAEHFHSNIELLYVVDGEIDVKINQCHGRLKKGDIAVSNGFNIHAYDTPMHSKTIFLIIPTHMIGIYNSIMAGRRFENPFLYAGEHSEELENAIHFSQRFDKSSGSLDLVGHIYVILGILLSNLKTVPDSDISSDNLIRNILMYLENNYLKPIKMTDLSNEFGYNKSYLSRVFNAHTNTSFNEYLNCLRVRHAARLIQITEHSMTRISEESGFSCPRNFNRAFLNMYKITPLEYKKHKTNPTQKGSDIDQMFRVFSYMLPDD